MSNESSSIEIAPAESVSHLSNHVDQMVSGQLDRQSAEDQAGDIIGRSFGLPEGSDDREAPSRSASDDTPYGFSDPLDAESAPRDEEESVDEKLDRLFDPKPPPKPAQPQQPKQPPRAETQQQEHEAPDEPVSSNLFSWEDLQRAQKFAAGRQQLMEAIHRHQQDVPLIEQIADPQRKAAALEWHHRREQEIRAAAEALDRVNGEFHKSAEDRMTARAERQVASERQKLQKAFPDLDVPKLRGALLERGYTEDQIRAASANDLIIAEESRRYRELKKQQPVRRAIKVSAKPAQPLTPEDRVGQLMERSLNGGSQARQAEYQSREQSKAAYRGKHR